MDNEQDYVIIWEAPKIESPEFRLYYDDKGAVVCYTTEKPEGNYIVIDKNIFAEARPDVVVIDGEISKVNKNMLSMKLKPDTMGQSCYKENVSIIVDDNYIDKQKWKLKIHEL